MKKIILLFLLLINTAIAFTQKETFDIVTYTIPKGWVKDTKENLVTYSFVNKKTNSWCQVAIVKSTVSKGSIEEDFKSEWQELIVKSYNVTDAPEVNELPEANGWKIKAGGGKFIFNNANAIAMLTTASGYNRCVSIVATTNNQDHIKDIESILASVDIAKPAINATAKTNNDATITGTWGSTASDQSSFRVKNGVMSYIKRQYTFHANGTYNFISKAYDPLITDTYLGRESGTYKLAGNTITLTPKKSVLESWSRKSNSDSWGKLLKTQIITPEQASYTFTKHYSSPTVLQALVLQAGKATKRDGPFNSTATEYGNCWFYDPLSISNPVIELPNGEKIAAEIQKEAAPSPVVKSPNGFKYTTTNFDDGWTSNIKEDWVETTKGNVKVLIHYPDKSADAYNSVLLDGLKNAWNILVAPKYSSASNFEFKPIQSWQSIEFAEADCVEKATGKTVHVVFFKKNFSGGQGKYLEFISTDKKAFEQEFGVYQKNDLAPMWEKMAAMANRNKFAVAASDLNGTWTNNFTGMTQYVNAYTGASAGADTHASSQKFIFEANNNYKWDIGVASGFVGNIKFQSSKSSGKYTMPSSWQIHFSDMEGKPKTYDAYFSCVKGSRLLWLSDITYPGYTAYGKAN